jgi:hypothetical protein
MRKLIAAALTAAALSGFAGSAQAVDTRVEFMFYSQGGPCSHTSQVCVAPCIDKQCYVIVVPLDWCAGIDHMGPNRVCVPRPTPDEPIVPYVSSLLPPH